MIDHHEPARLPLSFGTADMLQKRGATRPPTIRLAHEDDRSGLLRMHDRCGLDSRSCRWLAPLRAIPRDYLDSALAGHPDHIALVAEETLSGRLVGLASAVRGGDATYEIGVLVEDRYQGRGVGRALLQGLLERTATGSSVKLTAYVSVAQQWIADALARLGPACVERTRWATWVSVVVPSLAR